MNSPESTQQTVPPTVAVSGRRRRRALTLVCWMYLAVVLGLWLALQWADQWWPATVLMFAPRWIIALPLVLLLPLAALLRSKSILVALASAVIVVWPVMDFNVPWKRLTSPDPTGAPLRVMTLNMHYSKEAPKSLEDLIAIEKPEVVAVQEWSGAARSALNSIPGWHIHATPQLFLASRHPIRQAVEIGRNSTGEHASVAHYELDAPQGTVHVFSLHTASSRQGISETIKNLNGTAELRANSTRRREQSIFVAGKVAECRGPVLVMGDFNTPPGSPIFSEVWSGYTDAFSTAGWGWGYTFHGAKTSVRIDHILAGPGWVCTGCRIGPFVGSPHRPVIADLVWTGENAGR